MPLSVALIRICVLLLVPAGTEADELDYLNQIETQAKRQAATPVAASAGAAAAVLDAVERLPLGLQQEDFENTLKEQFVGTYVFYQRLTAADRRKIFEIYQQDNRVSTIREQTLKFLSGAP